MRTTLIVSFLCFSPLSGGILAENDDALQEEAANLIAELEQSSQFYHSEEVQRIVLDDLKARVHGRREFSQALGRLLEEADLSTTISAVTLIDLTGVAAIEQIPDIARAQARFTGEWSYKLGPYPPMERLHTIASETVVSEKHTEIIRAYLIHSDSSVRKWALGLLYEMGPRASRFVPDLRRALDSQPASDATTRIATLSTLSRLVEPEVAGRYLSRALSDDRPEVRRFAVYELVRREEVEKLREILNGDDVSLRIDTARRLQYSKVARHELLPELKRQFEAESLELRFHSANAIWSETHEASEILPVLRQLLHAEKVHYEIWHLLRAMDRSSAPLLPDYIEIANSSSAKSRTRIDVIYAIKSLGNAGAAAIPMLQRIAEDATEAEEVRVAAIETAATIGLTSDEIYSMLRSLLNSNQTRIVLTAAKWIRVRNPADETPIAALIGILERPVSDGTRRRVASLLEHYGVDAISAVPALIPQLRVQQYNDVYCALRSMGLAALPELRKAAEIPDEILIPRIDRVIEAIERDCIYQPLPP